MYVVPIQVTDEGVVIPKTYLHDADEVEVVVEADYILVRPKKGDASSEAGRDLNSRGRRYSFIASARTRHPQASMEAEDILEREIEPLDGWTSKS